MQSALCSKRGRAPDPLPKRPNRSSVAIESRKSRDCPGRTRNGTAPASSPTEENIMRIVSLAALVAAAALAGLSGCTGGSADRGSTADAAALSELTTPFTVPAGAQITVRLTSNLSSETAQVGDPWSGTLAAAITVGEREIIPAGTPVQGAVTGAHPAGLGTRAMLDLAIQDVSIAGATHLLHAGTDAILADLPVTQGGTPGRTAMGGETGNGVAPVEKGAEVVLASGTELVFTVKERSPVR